MNEFQFIQHLRAQAEKRGDAPGLRRAIGDDAAVLRQTTGRQTLITTDLLVEDIDFVRTASPPELLGHKALAISLSDIAAMGARPRWALSSIGVPQEVWDKEFVTRFYQGLFSLGDRYDVRLVGGDISRTPEKIVIDSIVLGECAGEQEVARAGAAPGDLLFVTGSLGGSAAGLRLLQRGGRIGAEHQDDPEWELVQELLLRHLRPEPRVGWGLVLGEQHLATAMIDISDGLSSDLHHLCHESRVGAIIDVKRLPLDSRVTELCGRRALDPLLLALNGGEDFELLFTVAPANVSHLPLKVDGVSLTHIGEIGNSSEGIKIREGSRIWDLKAEGWKHFA